MKPFPWAWPQALVLWGVMLWAFWPEFRIVRRAQKALKGAASKDAGSMQVIILGMWLAMAAAFPLASVTSLRVPDAWNLPVFALGIASLVGGSLLRRHCWRMLGNSFTGDVRAASDQVIVQRGAYAILRHPSYTAGILMNVGIGLSLGSWGSAALLLVASFAVYAYRIAVEERALLATVGEPYRAFMQGRKRLIPFVY